MLQLLQSMGRKQLTNKTLLLFFPELNFLHIIKIQVVLPNRTINFLNRVQITHQKEQQNTTIILTILHPKKHKKQYKLYKFHNYHLNETE